MKIIILIFFFTSNLFCKFEDIFEMRFYSVSTYSSKILKIDEGELIFYGEEGNLLRTYDNGATWHQNYSGTHAEVKKLLYHNNKVFGVTSDGEFMISEDKGDWWKYQKLSNGFSDMTIINSKIYLSTYSDSVFLSYDEGTNWEIVKLEIDSIFSINYKKNFIIIQNKNKELFKTSNLKNELEKLIAPFEFTLIRNNEENLYIQNRTSIAKLKNDLTWEVNHIFNEEKTYVFLEEDESYIIFAPNVSSAINFGLEVHRYNKNNSTLNLITRYFDYNFNFIGISNFELYPYEATYSNGEYILSNFHKTVLKSKNFINWNIVINGSHKTISNTTFYDDKVIYSRKNRKSNLIKSTDGGITFRQSWNILIDTIENKEYVPSILDYKLKNKDKGLILFERNSNNIDQSEKTNLKRFLLFENDKIKRLEYFIPYLFPSIHDIYIENFFGDDFLVYSSHNIKKTVPNEYNQYKDSIIKNVFYKLNENELDTLGSIRDTIKSFNILSKENIVWLWGKTNIPDANNKKYTKFYYSSDSCKSFNLSNFKVIEHPSVSALSDPVLLLFDKNGNYYIITNEFVEIYDSDFNHVNKIPTNSDLFYTKYNPNNLIEDVVFEGVKLNNNSGEVKYYYIDYNYEIIELNLPINNEVILRTINGSFYKIANLGYINIYRPIEPERLKYYSSVQKTETRNYLWTYPPYPQPTNNIVKIDTYWDSGLPFTEEDIEIYNLTGVKINTANTLSIQKESNYNGKIIWDASNQQPGIYILKINHGTETRVRKIMVVE